MLTANTTKLEINYIEWREMNVIFLLFSDKIKDFKCISNLHVIIILYWYVITFHYYIEQIILNKYKTQKFKNLKFSLNKIMIKIVFDFQDTRKIRHSEHAYHRPWPHRIMDQGRRILNFPFINNFQFYMNIKKST